MVKPGKSLAEATESPYRWTAEEQVTTRQGLGVVHYRESSACTGNNDRQHVTNDHIAKQRPISKGIMRM